MVELFRAINVNLDGQSPTPHDINAGVPHGSVEGIIEIFLQRLVPISTSPGQ